MINTVIERKLWSSISGNWTFYPEMKGGVDGIGEEEGRHLRDEEDDDFRMFVDEDADIDESNETTTSEASSEREKNVRLLVFYFLFLTEKTLTNLKIYFEKQLNN